ncbi:ABC1 kinase family protein [Cerasicoccus fimbriatus]|uniref:ABC1 kinase family protein n=1 Tax=Cerasicoccus fimbriatus TaxID=3014554 RepID=UPI0022B5BD7F|nr:AarF/UbiB family protein [Cerasicoccus sp. TK19100]
MNNLPHRLKTYAELAKFFAFHFGPMVNHSQNAAEGVATSDMAEDAEKFAKQLEGMGSTFVKFGQLLSTRTDLLAKPYIDALQRLQDDVEPVPFEDISATFEEDFGITLDKAFAEVKREPEAAASLGQTHRATTREGVEVIVKIQRPGVRRKVIQDLDVLDSVAAFASEHSESARNYRVCDLVDHFRDSIVGELNYRKEVMNLQTLAKNIERFPRLMTPGVHLSLCSERVITMDYIHGSKVTEISGVSLLDVDGEKLVDELVAAFLKQYLTDGFFHADPHPGNLLLTQDNRMAFIDLGMVGRLSETMSDALYQVFSGIAENKSERVTNTLLDVGYQGNHEVARAELQSDISSLIARQHDVTVSELQFGAVVMKIFQICADHHIIIPREFLLVAKSLLNLDRIAVILAPKFNLSNATRTHLKVIAAKRTVSSLKPSDLFEAALEFKELVQQAPHRLNNLLDNLADNKFRIDADVIDETALIQGFQKIANRITVGVITAALIIGAALMMRIETEFQIFGYPGFAMLLMIAAMFLGVTTIIGIWRTDK